MFKQQQNTVNQQQNTVKKSTSLKRQDIVKTTRYYGVVNFQGGPMFMAFVVNPYIPTNLKHNHLLNIY